MHSIRRLLRLDNPNFAPQQLPADIATPGGYRLTITPRGAFIEGNDPAGVYYGVQTLFSLAPAGGGRTPAMRIEDALRFSYRGMHVDLARNFKHPPTLRRLIEQMSAYKLNRLHIHLMPGHARAAVMSMEARYRRLHADGREQAAAQYRLRDPQDATNVTTVQFYDRHSHINPCVPSTLNFTGKVIHEIASMYADAQVPLRTWQFGGDEAKNIFLGGGFQALNGTDPNKGRVNLARAGIGYRQPTFTLTGE